MPKRSIIIELRAAPDGPPLAHWNTKVYDDGHRWSVSLKPPKGITLDAGCWICCRDNRTQSGDAE